MRSIVLPFFRKIRIRLIHSGQSRKYLVYAAGEITLVVIGILIALQVNNWNEGRKERNREVVLLEGLRDNLQKNISAMEKALVNHDLGIESADYIISVLEGSRPYSQKVDTLMNWAIYSNNLGRLSSVGFEALKNAGFEIIIDRALREEVLSLFEDTYRGMYGRFEWNYTEMWEDYLDRHFMITSPGGVAPAWHPFNFKIQMEDPYFISNINKIKRQRIWYKSGVEISLAETKRILELIRKKLGEE